MFKLQANFAIATTISNYCSSKIKNWCVTKKGRVKSNNFDSSDEFTLSECEWILFFQVDSITTVLIGVHNFYTSSSAHSQRWSHIHYSQTHSQNFYRHNLYVHLYNSDHLPVSSLCNITTWTVLLSPDHGAGHILVTNTAEEISN
jgi:hypothetical protein